MPEGELKEAYSRYYQLDAVLAFVSCRSTMRQPMIKSLLFRTTFLQTISKKRTVIRNWTMTSNSILLKEHDKRSLGRVSKGRPIFHFEHSVGTHLAHGDMLPLHTHLYLHFIAQLKTCPFGCEDDFEEFDQFVLHLESHGLAVRYLQQGLETVGVCCDKTIPSLKDFEDHVFAYHKPLMDKLDVKENQWSKLVNNQWRPCPLCYKDTSLVPRERYRYYKENNWSSHVCGHFQSRPDTEGGKLDEDGLGFHGPHDPLCASVMHPLRTYHQSRATCRSLTESNDLQSGKNRDSNVVSC
ncbi:hypothetical protein FRC02_004635 [Tulasnella sp. 418]|nr:hypothetical protein FRC02_004635 [Tulasnella sp. 418]